MTVERDPALQFEDARLARLLAWWRERTAMLGRLPGRRDFDPIAMKPLLPLLYMVDVEGTEGDRLRFRWRLIGTDLVAMAGRDMTGRWFDDLYQGETYDDFTRSYADAVRGRRPIRTSGTMAFAGEPRGFLPFEALKVPLASDGETVDLLVGMVVPKPSAAP